MRVWRNMPIPDGSAVSIDILGALADTAASPSGKKCKIQRWLDAIEPGTPGLDDLAAAVNTPRNESDAQAPGYRPLATTLAVLNRLGCSVGMSVLHQHRTQTCRCYR